MTTISFSIGTVQEWCRQVVGWMEIRDVLDSPAALVTPSRCLGMDVAPDWDRKWNHEKERSHVLSSHLFSPLGISPSRHQDA